MKPQGVEASLEEVRNSMNAANDLSRIRELLLPDLGELEKVEAMIYAVQSQQKKAEQRLTDANQKIAVLSEQVLRLERQNASLGKHIQQIEERQTGLLSRFGKKLGRRD